MLPNPGGSRRRTALSLSGEIVILFFSATYPGSGRSGSKLSMIVQTPHLVIL